MILEWMLIVVVAVMVFGPKEIPQLAYNLGTLWRYLNKQKQALIQLCEQDLLKRTLQDNEQRAKLAEDRYQQQSKLIE